MSARTDLCGGYRATDIPTAILGGSYDRRGLGLIKPGIPNAVRPRNDVTSKPFEGGAYVHQQLNFVAEGKAHR